VKSGNFRQKLGDNKRKPGSIRTPGRAKKGNTIRNIGKKNSRETEIVSESLGEKKIDIREYH